MAVRNLKRRSSVWFFFETESYEPTLARCKLCGAYFQRSNNTSNLIKHLKCKHLCEYQLSKRDHPLSTTLPQNDLMKKKYLDNSLVEMMALDLQPATIVTDKGFAKFVDLMDPKYVLPSYNELSDVLLPDKYNEVKIKLQAELQAVQSVSLSTELWTPHPEGSYRYLSLTAHYVTSDWEVKSCLLEVIHIIDVSQTRSENIASEIYKILCEWKLESKVLVMIIDGSPDMPSIMEHLNFDCLTCFGAMLNLLVDECLKSDEVVMALQKKCNDIGLLFHTNLDSLEKLNMIEELNIPCKNLLRDVSAHWNTTYQMFERICEHLDAVNVVVTALSLPDLIISPDELKVLKETVALLEPFIHASNDMTSENFVSLSKVIPLVKLLLYATNNSEANLTMKNLLFSELQRKFFTIEENEFMSFSTLLDPRFKKIGFQDDQCCEKESLRLAEKIATDSQYSSNGTVDGEECKSETGNSLWNIFDQQVKAPENEEEHKITVTEELNRFCQMNLVCRNSDPFLWWKLNGVFTPTLTCMARRYLGCPALASLSERLFTKAGHHFLRKIGNLKKKSAGMVLFLHANLKLVE